MDNICYNGQIIDTNKFSLSITNRGFRYGDSFFETIKCYQGNPLFFEEHYFRMAASFCLMKLTPPDIFDIDHFKSLIRDLLMSNNMNQSARVRISFFRCDGGYYLPMTNNTHFFIESEVIDQHQYILNKTGLRIGVYKDNFLPKNVLGSLKTNNRLINILASIYANENNYDDCVLMNESKNLVESISGNIFIVQDGVIKTPSLEEGCIDGVIRKILINQSSFQVIEKAISFSDILNANELFLTNVISGVKWIHSINNSIYTNSVAKTVINYLNRYMGLV
tara:strand:+ start:489 stop:1325 length:837 start_codon:yes stop_codon:yes gene_type:complete